MKTIPRIACWLACAVPMGIAPARAQEPDAPRPYVRFEIKPDFEKMLKARLLSERSEEHTSELSH